MRNTIGAIFIMLVVSIMSFGANAAFSKELEIDQSCANYCPEHPTEPCNCSWDCGSEGAMETWTTCPVYAVHGCGLSPC